MKSMPAALQAHLDEGTTTLAWCWRVTRRDGAVFGFTNHDRDLAFDGTAFEAEAGLTPAELRGGTDLSVDAQDAEGVLSSGRITETDILDGLWDGAAVEVWRVNWADTSQRVLLRRGALGQIRRGRLAFVAEVRSMAHKLNETTGRTFQYTCDAALGDARCRVNLEDAAYRGAGAVAAVVEGRGFLATGLSEFDPGWFALGTVTWGSGTNAGRVAEVAMHEVVPAGVRITLLEEPVRAIAPGDAFVIRAGCDKCRETCAAKFSNIVNFRGFPEIPGSSTMLRYARPSGSNSGGVL